MAYTILLHFKYREPHKVAFRGALDSAIANATEYMRIHKADGVQVVDLLQALLMHKSQGQKRPAAVIANSP